MLGDALDDFLLALQADGLSPNTVRWYKEKLRRVIAAIGEDKPVEEVSIRDLRAFVADLRARKSRYSDHRFRPEVSGGLSPSCIHGYVKAIRRFFRWLVAEGVITENPAARLKLPKLPKQTPKGVALEDIRKLLEAARGNPRDYALLLFLIDTGCRVGEICGLTIEDLNLAEGMARVQGKGRKERVVMFGEVTARALAQWLEVRPAGKGDAVFPGKQGALTPDGVRMVLRRLKKKAGVTGRCNPHSFRHAFAREYLLNGGDLASLADLLGHADVGVTKDFYSVFTRHELKEKHCRHSPLKRVFDKD